MVVVDAGCSADEISDSNLRESLRLGKSLARFWGNFFSGVNMKVVAVHVSINGLRFELKNYQFSNVCEIFRLIIKG